MSRVGCTGAGVPVAFIGAFSGCTSSIVSVCRFVREQQMPMSAVLSVHRMRSLSVRIIGRTDWIYKAALVSKGMNGSKS